VKPVGDPAINPVRQRVGLRGSQKGQPVRAAIDRLLVRRIHGLPERREIGPLLNGIVERMDNRIVIHEKAEREASS